MNAPQALYWYHQQPSTADYRNSSSNSTGPWTSSIDPTGKPGVFGLVKYVPEETVADAVVTEGVTEYERGLKDSAILWRNKLAAEREKAAQQREALQPLAGFIADLEMPAGAFRLRAKDAMTYEQFQAACRALHQIIGDLP